MTPTPKLAICLQVCPLDVFLGQRLVKLICSIEPAKRADIEFIVSARRDTNPVTVAAIATLAATRFANVRVIKGKRFGTGWPQGCNDLWQETMMRVSQMHDSGHIKSDGVLTFEADCLPLRPDWLNQLALEWAHAKGIGKLICGHAHCWPLEEDAEQAGKPGHINGNAIFHCSATDRLPALNGSDARVGWDCYHSKLLLTNGVDTPMIAQKYRIKSIQREQIEAIRKDGQIPALFHGIKGEGGLEAVEAMVADQSFFARKDSDRRGCIVKAHDGGGLFSLLNKVVSAARLYNGDVHVDWSERCLYGTPGQNAFNELFAPTQPPTGPFEIVQHYPEYSLTFRFAGALYGDNIASGWREQCNAIWQRFEVKPEIQKAADDFVKKIKGGFIGVMVRANVHGAEQPTKRNQELGEYGAEIIDALQGDEKIFVMTSDKETLAWFQAQSQFGNHVIFFPETKRVETRDSTELHTSGGCDIDDAKLCLTEILVMAQARAMIHPVSNMATAALYINPALQSIYIA